jgi:hypothetical protein
MTEDVRDVLWPDDAQGIADTSQGPDTELAVILLAAGCSQSFIRTRCGFESQRDVQAFCRDDDVRREASELAGERNRRLGRRASVSLEKILATEHTDLRAQVLAIRTALEVSGDLKRDHAAPVKTVRELSVAELSELIDVTRQELEARTVRQKSDRARIAQEKH